MAQTVKDKIGAPDIIGILIYSFFPFIICFSNFIIVIMKIGLLTVNNAAIMSEKMKMWEIAAEMFDDVIDINIKGTVNILRHFIPLLIPKSQGIIVNISSLFGKMGGVQVRIYCDCKQCKTFIGNKIHKLFFIN